MFEKKNVLVICQTAACQMYLGVLLKRIWYKSILAKTAEEGVFHAQKNSFDLIVFDGDIPEPERDSSVSVLRSDPSVKDIPLVAFITDKGQSCQSLLAQGCSAVVTKPLDVSFVYRVLARLSGQVRQSPRVPILLQVEVEERSADKYLAGIDISEGGMYLRTIDPLPEKQIIHLRFKLPRDASDIQVAGEIVRTEMLGVDIEKEPGMAVQFVDLSEENQKRIRNFIQWQLTEDLKWEATI